MPDDADEELLCDDLLCVEDIECSENQNDGSVGWKWKTLVTEDDVQHWKSNHPTEDFLFVASNAKRDRSEVKLHQLSKSEQVSPDLDS